MEIIKEFKVGKMNWDGKIVEACIDKGLLQIVKDNDDVYKIRWYNKEKKTFENEVIIEKEMKFEEIKESKSNKVFVLKKKNISFYVYWIQDKNLLIENLLSELNNEIELYTNVGNNNLNNTLKSLLEQISSNNNNNNNRKKILLSNILTNDIIDKLKDNEEFINELRNHMPKNQDNDKDVISAFNCPQVKYTLRLLDESIYSDQLITLSTALGLNINYDSLMDSNPMELFIKALHDKYYKK